jgi:hypothetical protein
LIDRSNPTSGEVLRVIAARTFLGHVGAEGRQVFGVPAVVLRLDRKAFEPPGGVAAAAPLAPRLTRDVTKTSMPN